VGERQDKNEEDDGGIKSLEELAMTTS